MPFTGVPPNLVCVTGSFDMTYVALAALASHSFGDILPWAVTTVATAWAAASDVRTRRIPNRLTFPLLLSGLCVAASPGSSVSFQSALLGMLLLGIPFFLLFIFAGGGAGDAKIMGAVGTWVGLSGAVAVLVAVTVSGGLLALGYALIRRRLGTVRDNLRTMTMGASLLTLNRAPLSSAQDLIPQQHQMLTMPYGLSIFMGTVIAAVWVIA
jgi:prepilin peptidase CpaA